MGFDWPKLMAAIFGGTSFMNVTSRRINPKTVSKESKSSMLVMVELQHV